MSLPVPLAMAENLVVARPETVKGDDSGALVEFLWQSITVDGGGRHIRDTNDPVTDEMRPETRAPTLPGL